MGDLIEAKYIRLTKRRPMAPPFHQHIARGKLLGRSCRIGDRVVVYEITATEPAGDVLITEETVIHFD